MQNDMELKLSVALDNTLERLLQELQYTIDDVVYGWQSPSSNPWGYGENGGNRTHQFYDSWQKSSPMIIGNLIQGEIYQAVEIMQQIFSGGQPVHIDRDELAEIINTGDGYNFGEADGVQRPLWDIFEAYCNENLENIFYQECIKLGLPIQPVSGVFR